MSYAASQPSSSNIITMGRSRSLLEENRKIMPSVDQLSDFSTFLRSIQ
jgi:hypothetical protein